jgi:hypothetical protein
MRKPRFIDQRRANSTGLRGWIGLALSIALLGLESLSTSAAELTFERQIITFPTNITSSARQQISSRFIDLDGDGLADLLTLSVAESRLWIYRQRATGFAATPDQTMNLP